eukprot:TRINITY_DN5119_c0_g2_i2.p1 TRINITY_DN5119_c0_g2~~TRINITY_DN5119_c0_g2_i2.p1  ORF type:complete len:418 (+),score=97.19 TRINITY_DN5119_c0_g2_i2:148-1401(+)
MDYIVQEYMKPLRAEEIITEEQILQIFSNTEMILGFNQRLRDSLIEAKEDEGNLGEVFVTLAPWLKCYSEYCDRHTSAINLCLEITKNNREFRKFIEERNKENGLQLKDFLIKPIQRICKYPLLLRELLACTLETDMQYPMVNQSLKTVQDIADHVNSVFEHRENFHKLLEYENCIIEYKKSIFSQGRIFLLEHRMGKGSTKLGKMLKKSVETRVCILFNDTLIYCKGQLGAKELLFKGELELHLISVFDSDESHPAHETTFRLDSYVKNKSFWFFCDSPENKRDWLEAITHHSVEQKRLKAEEAVMQSEGSIRIKDSSSVPRATMRLRDIATHVEKNIEDAPSFIATNMEIPKHGTSREARKRQLEDLASNDLIDYVIKLENQYAYTRSKAVAYRQLLEEFQDSEDDVILDDFDLL